MVRSLIVLNVVSGPPPLDDMSEFVKKLSGNQVQFDKVQVSQQTSTTEVRNITHFSILLDSITHYYEAAREVIKCIAKAYIN